MPRDGALTFGDLEGKLDVLRVACRKCDPPRPVYGRDSKLVDWHRELGVRVGWWNGEGTRELRTARPRLIPRRSFQTRRFIASGSKSVVHNGDCGAIQPAAICSS